MSTRRSAEVDDAAIEHQPKSSYVPTAGSEDNPSTTKHPPRMVPYSASMSATRRSAEVDDAAIEHQPKSSYVPTAGSEDNPSTTKHPPRMVPYSASMSA